MVQGKDEQVSIRTAAKYLGVSDKTIMRYMAKGLLSKINEGHRTFAIVEELRGLKTEKKGEQKRIKKKEGTVILSKDSYDKLLTELGALQERTQNLLEYRQTNKKLELELNQAKGQVSETNSWLKEVVEENKEKEKQTQEKISHLEEQNQHLKSSSIFTIQKKDDELKELRKNLTELQRELTRVKKRGFFKRIFNK